MEKSISELIREGEEKNNLKVNPLPDKAVSLNDLKPCPFCGGEAELLFKKFLNAYVAWCPKCVITTKFMLAELAGKERAIKTWNRRVNNEPTD